MKFVKKLLESEEYAGRLRKLKDMERERVYCRHDLDHFLHVARIAYILSVEQGLELDKEQIYLCGLLHDLGRVEEYRSGISHAEASAGAAGEILRVLGYDREKAQEVCYAVSRHSGRINLRERDGEDGAVAQWEQRRKNAGTVEKEQIGKETERRELLARVLALADQLSRNCFACEARESCKWKDEEKTTGGDLI